MISIPRPSMALHSHNVPGYKYVLENNWTVPAGDPIDHVLGWPASYAKTRGGLVALVINCHGKYNAAGCGGTSTGGYGLSIGEGIYRWHTSKFSVLSGLVTNIIITACGTARISEPGTSGNGDGNLFCSEIAKASGAYVIAGTTHQVGDLWLPNDTIDDFEGLVLRYSPSGGVDWSYDYGRGLIDGLINGWD
jgi:hypothetical protein